MSDDEIEGAFFASNQPRQQFTVGAPVCEVGSQSHTLRCETDSGLWHTETIQASLDRPYFATCSPHGHLVVSDCMNHRVMLLSTDGTVLR